MKKEEQKQPKWVELLAKVSGKVNFNPYNKKHLTIFLSVVAVTAGVCGYYGLKPEKKEEKK